MTKKNMWEMVDTSDKNVITLIKETDSSNPTYGKVVVSIKKLIRVELKKKPPVNVFPQDIALLILGEIYTKYSIDECAIEIYGEAIDSMSVPVIMTIIDMLTGFGAIGVWITPHRKSIKKNLITCWSISSSETFDKYNAPILLDTSRMEPVYFKANCPVKIETEKAGKIDIVFIGPHTSNYLEELRIVALVVEYINQKVHVESAIISIPDSEIYRQAKKEGLLDLFEECEFEIHGPNHKYPVYLIDEKDVERKKMCTSTPVISSKLYKMVENQLINETYLFVSPATAAMTALVGNLSSAAIAIFEEPEEEHDEIEYNLLTLEDIVHGLSTICSNDIDFSVGLNITDFQEMTNYLCKKCGLCSISKDCAFFKKLIESQENRLLEVTSIYDFLTNGLDSQFSISANCPAKLFEMCLKLRKDNTQKTLEKPE